MSVQRWKPNKATERYWSEGMRFDADGAYVTYADHAEALAEAEQEAGERSHGHYMDGYAEALRQAREAVVALAPSWAVRFYVPRASDGAWIGCNGAHEQVDILAALDALDAGQAPAAAGEVT